MKQKKKAYTIQELMNVVVAFRDERDWKQFHNPKDSAVALSLEAMELLEQFRWQNKTEMKKHVKDNKKAVADELSDVLFWILLMSHDLKIDIGDAFYKKRDEDAKKYPIDKVRGKHKKYTEYI